MTASRAIVRVAICGLVTGSLGVVHRKAAANEVAYVPPTALTSPPSAHQESTAADLQTHSLTLREVIELAVKNNLGIQLARLSVQTTRSRERQALGSFEPAILGSYRHSNSQTPPESNIDGDLSGLFSVTTDEWTAGAEKRTRWGSTLSLNFTNQRASSTLQSALVPLLYSSQLQLRLSQPLLRGFDWGDSIAQAEVLRAHFATEQAQYQAEVQLLSLVSQCEQAYWDLFEALKVYELQSHAVQLAEQQLHLTQRQIDSGVRPPVDLLNAEGTVAQRKLQRMRADNERLRTADQLRFLLNMSTDQWQGLLLPQDPLPFEPTDVPFDQSLVRALQHRPEVRQRQVQRRAAAFEQQVAENNALPNLDANVSYGLLGRRSEYGATLDQLSSNQGRVWSAGVNFRWTPFNEQARAAMSASRLAVRSAQTQQQTTEAEIRFQLRNALRQLHIAARSVQAAGNFRHLAERSLSAEQRRYLNGTSDNFFISQRQNDVNAAKLAELSALVQHRKAATALQAAMGVLLQAHRIELLGPNSE